MLNFLALMIAFGMLLWLITSVVVFVGGFAYYFFKDIFKAISKEMAIAKARSNIKPLTINKKPFFKILSVIIISFLLFYISENTTDASVIVGSIVGLLALSCYCFYQSYKSFRQNKKLY
jgi:heme/copper-type cytochrome/quinol oxidase subunit 3